MIFQSLNAQMANVGKTTAESETQTRGAHLCKENSKFDVFTAQLLRTWF